MEKIELINGHITPVRKVILVYHTREDGDSAYMGYLHTNFKIYNEPQYLLDNEAIRLSKHAKGHYDGKYSFKVEEEAEKDNHLCHRTEI